MWNFTNTFHFHTLCPPLLRLCVWQNYDPLLHPYNNRSQRPTLFTRDTFLPLVLLLKLTSQDVSAAPAHKHNIAIKARLQCTGVLAENVFHLLPNYRAACFTADWGSCTLKTAGSLQGKQLVWDRQPKPPVCFICFSPQRDKNSILAEEKRSLGKCYIKT